VILFETSPQLIEGAFVMRLLDALAASSVRRYASSALNRSTLASMAEYIFGAFLLYSVIASRASRAAAALPSLWM
jgi:hypothetical protein